MCKIVKPLLKRGFTDVSSFKVKENKNDSNQNSGFSEGNCQIYVTTVSAKAKGKNQSFTCLRVRKELPGAIAFCSVQALAAACVCRSITMHFLAGIFLLPSFMVWKQAYCQPTYSTMRHSPTTAIVRPTGVICVKLLTKENAFFDPETELMFKCSTSTCPGVFGCVKCCPKLNRKKAQIAETTRSKACRF